jgi:hypothetical protein
MALPQWSRRSLVVAASIFAVGGFLVGSAASQQERRGADGEVGRYQMIHSPHDWTVFVFDTKTSRYWSKNIAGEGDWKNHLGPLAGREKPAGAIRKPETN